MHRSQTLAGIVRRQAFGEDRQPKTCSIAGETSWKFKILYILGKLLGGTDALSRYGVRHEDWRAEETNKDNRKNLKGLLAEGITDQIALLMMLFWLLLKPIPLLLAGKIFKELRWRMRIYKW